MSATMWLVAALGFGFFAYLMYTRQFKWMLGVVRNTIIGVAGILIFNLMLAGLGLAVGVNAVTALVVGVLGAPGFLLLYAAQMLVA